MESSVENRDDEDLSEISKGMCSEHRANHDFVWSSSSQTVHRGLSHFYNLCVHDRVDGVPTARLTIPLPSHAVLLHVSV
jgi:hypothetical protein